MKKLFYLFATVFLLNLTYSCENDAQEVASETGIKAIQKKVNLSQSKNTNIAKNIVFDWNKIQRSNKNGIEIVEVEVNEKVETKLISDSFTGVRYKLINLKNDKIDESFLIEFFIEKNTSFPHTIENFKNFSGILNIYSLNGIELSSIGAKNGLLANNTNNQSLSALVDLINSYSESEINKFPMCTAVLTFNMENWTDHYVIWATAAGNVIATYYTGSTYNYTTTTYSQVPYICGQAPEPESGQIRTPNHQTRIGFATQSEFFSDLMNTVRDGYEINSNRIQNQIISTVKLKLLPWYGIKFSVSQNAGNPVTVQTVTSTSFGAGLGVNWQQDNYSQSTSGNITTVIANGTLNYTVFYNGIGTVYSQPITIRIYLNNTNGTIISATRLP